jgi:hypothetical protein
VQPYARKDIGEPLCMAFDLKRRTFELEFRHDPAVSAPTEVFVPNYQYPDGCVVEISDGIYEWTGLARSSSIGTVRGGYPPPHALPDFDVGLCDI